VEDLIREWREEGQWIVLMGFMVSLGIFFLALIINQSTIVGQTTAEGVLEFPKNDVQDLRAQLLDLTLNYSRWVDPLTALEPPSPEFEKFHIRMAHDIENLTLHRKSAIVNYSIGEWDVDHRNVIIHYNNGVFEYDESANIKY
jgi:hypothetical protein